MLREQLLNRETKVFRTINENVWCHPDMISDVQMFLENITYVYAHQPIECLCKRSLIIAYFLAFTKNEWFKS